MDIPGQLIPWLVLGVSTLTAVAFVFAVRHLIRRAGHERVYDDGVVISDSGIEYFGFFFTGTRMMAYGEIASVDLIPYYKYALSRMVFIYGFSTRFIRRTLFGKIVVIRFKHPNPIEYLFFQPKDADIFYTQLKNRIGNEKHVA